MILYSKYLEDNVNDVFNRTMEEYRKYVKIYYSENSKCPADLKTVLEKEENSGEIRLWCKMKNGKIWNTIIQKPVIINLNIKLQEITEKYNNQSMIFKNILKQNLYSSVYIPEKDKEIEKKLLDLKRIETELESINEVFNKEKETIDNLIKKRQDILKNLLELKIKKNNIFLKCPLINADTKRKLIEISKNETDISASRIEQIAKNVNLKVDETKSWIEYFKLIMDYVQENALLDDINKEIMELKEKYERINSFFIIDPPIINADIGADKVIRKDIVEKVEEVGEVKEFKETEKVTEINIPVKEEILEEKESKKESKKEQKKESKKESNNKSKNELKKESRKVMIKIKKIKKNKKV